MGGGKDADMSPFEAGRKLLSLESERLSLNDRIDLVFQDADLVPLLVQVGIRMSASCTFNHPGSFRDEESCQRRLVQVPRSLSDKAPVFCRRTTSTIGQRLLTAKSLA